MHDTPQQSLFNRSSGSIRRAGSAFRNVRDLVTWLLKDTPDWNRQRFEQTIKSGDIDAGQLPNPVPVYFTTSRPGRLATRGAVRDDFTAATASTNCRSRPLSDRSAPTDFEGFATGGPFRFRGVQRFLRTSARVCFAASRVGEAEALC